MELIPFPRCHKKYQSPTCVRNAYSSIRSASFLGGSLCLIIIKGIKFISSCHAIRMEILGHFPHEPCSNSGIYCYMHISLLARQHGFTNVNAQLYMYTLLSLLFHYTAVSTRKTRLRESHLVYTDPCHQIRQVLSLSFSHIHVPQGNPAHVSIRSFHPVSKLKPGHFRQADNLRK